MLNVLKDKTYWQFKPEAVTKQSRVVIATRGFHANKKTKDQRYWISDACITIKTVARSNHCRRQSRPEYKFDIRDSFTQDAVGIIYFEGTALKGTSQNLCPVLWNIIELYIRPIAAKSKVFKVMTH